MFNKRLMATVACALALGATAPAMGATTAHPQPFGHVQWHCWFRGFGWSFSAQQVTVTATSSCANWQSEDSMRLYAATAGGQWQQIGWTGPGKYATGGVVVRIAANCKGLNRHFKAVDYWSDGFLTYSETSTAGPKNC